MTFYNPYNFVPLKKQGNKTERHDITYGAIAEGETHIRHDAWLNTVNGDDKYYTGRLIVKASTLSPTIVGNQHSGGVKNTSPNDVTPYTYNKEQALPGSSLRGMLSSVVETVSQSNMRVLPNQTYSARASMDDSLSAIGMVEVKLDDEGKPSYSIVPLKLPTIEANNKEFSVPQCWIDAFGADSTLGNSVGYYIHGFEESKKATKVGFLKPGGGRYSGQDPDSYRHQNPEFYLAPEVSHYRNVKLSSVSDATKNEVSKAYLTAQAVLSDKSDGGVSPPHHLISKFRPGVSNIDNKVKGIVYVLDREAGSSDFPKNKTKQWFIPYDDSDPEFEDRPRLKLAQSVVDIWQTIAQERFKASAAQEGLKTAEQIKANRKDIKYPVFPKGIDKVTDEGALRPLQHGDLVYFAIDETAPYDKHPAVSCVSYSAIWRHPIGSAHQYFKGYLPFGAKHSEQAERADSLSPAEYIFGTIEQGGGSCALASRVSIGDGLSLGEVNMLSNPEDVEGKYILSILGGPKAPSPAMYFKPQATKAPSRANTSSAGDYLSKLDMSQVHQSGQHEKHVPNGWKRYLPRRGELEEQSWHDEAGASDRPHLRVKAKPIATNNDFYFPIDFNNLSEHELGLLLCAIVPGEGFCHRLGLGKSLGLGMLKLSVDRLLLVDRADRYRSRGLIDDSVSVPRYQHVYLGDTADDSNAGGGSSTKYAALFERFPNDFSFEGKALQLSAFPPYRFTEHLNKAESLIDTDSLAILNKLGDPQQLDASTSVSFPKSEAQRRSPSNTEGFKWFTYNEHRKNYQKQSLGEVKPNRQTPLPTLENNSDPTK